MKSHLIILLVFTFVSCKYSVKAPVTSEPLSKASPVDTYYNSRYQYSIAYLHTFIPQPESENGDGRIFKDTAGNKVLTVYGCSSFDIISNKNIFLEDRFALDIKEKNENKAVITYKKLGKKFFVISGYSNDKLFYQKTISGEDAFMYAIIEFNKDQKETFELVSDLVFKSFKI